MKYWLYGLFLLIHPCFAQEVQYGRVLDATTKTPLPFVNVVVNDNAYGTTTDIDGKYTIRFEGTIQLVRFSFVGYEARTFTRNTFPSDGIIYLNEKQSLLGEVVITTNENPAHRIIRRAAANKRSNNPENITSFRYRSYNKLYSNLQVISPDKEIQLKDSAEINALQFFAKRHLFMAENISERKFRRPSYSKETVIANRFSGFKDPNFASIATDFQPFSFYEDYITILDKKYLNPVSKGTFNLYDFTLEDTLYRKVDTIYVISFRPLPKKNFLGLQGIVYINTNRYAVQNVVASSAAPKELISFKIEQKYRFIENKAWFPTELDTEFTFNSTTIANRKLQLISQSYLQDIQLDTPLDRGDFDEVTFEILPRASEKDSLFWKNNRFDTLSTKEKETFRFLDSLRQETNFEVVADIVDIATFGKIPIFKILDVPLKTLLDFNEFEGFRVGLGLYTNPRLSERFTLGGYFAYGTNDRLWKYGGSLLVSLYQPKDVQVGFQYQQDVFEPAQSVLSGSIDWLNSQFRSFLIARMDRTSLYETFLRFRPIRYVQMKVGLQHTTVEPGYPYRYVATDIPSRSFNFTEVTVQLTYRHKQSYIKVAGRKQLIGAGFPIVSLRYTRGIEGWWENPFDYHKIEMLFEHQIRFKKLGESHMRLQGGWLNTSLPYPKLFNLYASNTSSIPYIVDHSFQTADLYEFTAERYIALFYRHNFGTLFFRGERFRPHFILVHNTAIGALDQPALHEEIATQDFSEGFLESGLEIDRLLQLKYLGLFYIDIGGGVFYRYGPYRHPTTADNWVFKFALRTSF
ncbi:MAG: DUF5686 family protein [Bacteroidota bacterium]